MAREMKDSGIEWIGEIPSDWNVVRIKNLADNHQENSFIDGDWIESPDITDSGIRYLTTGNVGDGQYKQQGNGFITVDTFNRLNCKYAYPGDLVIARLNAPYGRACILPNDYPEYVLAVDIVILRTLMDKHFLCYQMQCSGYQHAIEDDAKGTTMKRISRTNLGKIPLVIAPLDVQHRIAAFLDHKCAEIDSVIAATQRTIEEYKSLKQSIITEAVTKGIRGERPMKDSGIEWIGAIPADWQVSPLQYYVELNKSTLGEDTPADYEFDYVEIGAVTLENGISEYQRYKFSDAPSRARRVVQPNDIIISTVRTYLKAIAIVPEKENVVVSTGFAVLTPRNINIDYLGFALKSEYFVHTVTANSVGISYPAINSSDLVKFKIAIPTKEEQEEIAEYLGKKCIEMDTLIAKKTALLAEMESYKKSVIYEYVTGKKEVTV